MESKKKLNYFQRNTISKKYDLGRNASEIAFDLDIKFQTVVSVINRYKKTGSSFAVQKRNPKTQLIDDDTKHFIKEKNYEDVSITLVTLQNLLRTEK